MPETLILVDEEDNIIGTEEKLKAHIDGLLHRAFSVMIFNNNGQLLIQKRAKNKYHSAGLWANSCCGHPRLGEDNTEAAQRRLQEELGFSCDLVKISELKYSLKLQNGLYEKEYTHIFAGTYEGNIEPNPDEVSEIKWESLGKLQKKSTLMPKHYAPWFNLYLNKYYKQIFENAAKQTSKA
ncbi:MAG: isopentenyl-diphosphate Delta-isomerase [Rickettsiaceae bacterium]|nr:isopentenyl-diphosphate Delta-isomerase [Rickettsiaceae bacterium]